MKVHPHPEPDEPFNYRNSMLWRRFLVFALGLSFLACLLALWLTGTVFSNPIQLLSLTLMIFIQSNRLAILIVPLLSLLVCYLLLRHVTGDIMACPDRYLDERQRMVRDRAHHHAYKIVNFACLLIVLCLSLNAILFPVPARGIVPRRVISFSRIVSTYGAKDKPVVSMYRAVSPGTPGMALQPMPWKLSQAASTVSAPDQYATQFIKLSPDSVIVDKSALPNQTIMVKAIAGMPGPLYESVAWPDDPVSISIFYGVLLLSLFLLVKVLPMSVVAWKERT